MHHRRLTLVCLLLLSLLGVALGAAEAPVTYALRRLDAALAELGQPAAASVGFAVTADYDPALGPEGFAIERAPGGAVSVRGGDARGVMYGVLDVRDQLRRAAGDWTAVAPRTVHARFGFRTIKFNLPYAAYRTSPSIELHQEVCKDPAYWEAFLDMMADNRFNTLTLWSLHPFQFFVVPQSYPEAQTYSDAEMAEWRALWTRLFAMAKERGIDTYLINWNTFVSPEFARAHDVATWSLEWLHFGPGTTDPLVEDYTRECVTQVIDEYPDLTGLGITLGERMGGQTPDERREWLQRTFFDGIAAASRPIKFIYRAPLSADKGSGGTTSEENDRHTRAQLESLRDNPNILEPVWLEFKYNWSHGHSSPHLFIVHGGKLSGIHWTPPPDNYRVVWTVRNEDFYVLRWAEPDFIRAFVANNGHDYVGGALVGSEIFVPAKDYISKPGRHRTWRYLFERNWQGWAVWGRLLHEPTTPDAVFAAEFERRFGGGRGPELLEAWKHASRMPLRFASFHQGRNDLSLYTEAFSGWRERGGEWRFFGIDNFIAHPVLDTRYVNIRDYVAAGERVGPGQDSPLDLAADVEAEASAALAAAERVRARGEVSAALDCELTDIACWAAYGRYFAAKLRGGVALERYRHGGSPADQAEAVAQLETASAHWRELARLGQIYNWRDIPFHTAVPFSWERLQTQVDHDLEIARSTHPAAPNRNDH